MWLKRKWGCRMQLRLGGQAFKFDAIGLNDSSDPSSCCSTCCTYMYALLWSILLDSLVGMRIGGMSRHRILDSISPAAVVEPRDDGRGGRGSSRTYAKFVLSNLSVLSRSGT